MSHPTPHRRLTRREFGQLLGAGTAARLVAPGFLPPALARVAKPPVSRDEVFWQSIRERFVMPNDLAMMNAANLCPSSASVLESLYRHTRDIDRDPSPNNRVKMGEGREATRRLIAEFLRVTPGEIVITRNTSEANNLVSSGLDLKSEDEVIIFSDNHPSNHAAWREKARRFGFTVKVVEQVNPHPGAEFYLAAFEKQFTSRTKVLAFTHVTNTVGDLLPANELCRAARKRGVLTLVDGAQSFGLMDVNLSEMQPDFYSGSAHKWPCGPKEVGVLFVREEAQARIWPSILSLYAGAVGISKTFEAFGQRDEPAIIAFGDALKFQNEIGRPLIERRARELAQALLEGLRKLDEVRVWTDPNPQHSVAVVSFRPGTLDARKLATTLYEQDRIVCAARAGTDRPGLRFSPHFYNSHREVERTLTALKRYLTRGI